MTNGIKLIILTNILKTNVGAFRNSFCKQIIIEIILLTIPIVLNISEKIAIAVLILLK